MTETDKLKMLKAITGEGDEDVLSTYLKLSNDAILTRLYPFDDLTDEVSIEILTPLPIKYHTLQVEIAAYMLNKRGAEGQSSHSENGISRTYEDGDIPPTLLRRIVPMASAIVTEENADEDDYFSGYIATDEEIEELKDEIMGTD